MSDAIMRRISEQIRFALRNLRIKLNDAPNQLIFIHIGKCGGTSAHRALIARNQEKNKYYRLERIHLRKPVLLKQSKYVFVVRDPFRRYTSALNYMHSILVNSIEEQRRYPGQLEILEKYGSINAFLQALYNIDGTLNEQAHTDFFRITHCRENIQFYLDSLLKGIRKDQIAAIINQESLESDYEKFFGATQLPRLRVAESSVSSLIAEMSGRAASNLTRLCRKEYEVLAQLNAIQSG